MSNPRHKAWATRRKKYGSAGHSGSYARWRKSGGDHQKDNMRKWLVRLHVEGVLSEGQLMDALLLDRIKCRELRDDYIDSQTPEWKGQP